MTALELVWRAVGRTGQKRKHCIYVLIKIWNTCVSKRIHKKKTEEDVLTAYICLYLFNFIPVAEYLLRKIKREKKKTLEWVLKVI